MSLLVVRVCPQSCCLQLAALTDASTLKGRACFLHSQLRGLAVETESVLVYEIVSLTSLTPQGRSHFRRVLVLARATYWVGWGRSHFGGVPAKAGWLGGTDRSTEEH